MHRRIKLAAALIIAGLLIEFATSFSSHPTAFLLFLILGGALIALGILCYLLALMKWTAPAARVPDKLA